MSERSGAPGTIVPDNLKAAVVRAAFGVGAASLNRSYRELARHYSASRSPICAPKEKGKVESGVKVSSSRIWSLR